MTKQWLNHFENKLILKKKFYQLSEQKITIYNNDELLGEGLCYGIFENWWEEELEDYERGEFDYFIVSENKILVEGVDYKYDDIVWGEDYEVHESEDLKEIQKMFIDFKESYNPSS